MEEMMEIAFEKMANKILNNSQIIEKLIQKNNDYELLSANQISNETGIAPSKVRELFNANLEELGVQTYTKPMLVTRLNWNKFISKRR